MVSDAVASRLSVPLMHDLGTIATLFSDAFSLLREDQKQFPRSEVDEAWLNQELVWSQEDDPGTWEPALIMEIQALIRVFRHVLEPVRICITAEQHMPYGSGDCRITIYRIVSGGKVSWKIMQEPWDAVPADGYVDTSFMQNDGEIQPVHSDAPKSTE